MSKRLDHACSVFLRAVVRRMKALGLNQSELARRMKVSRAYVSKALQGDVNISFMTACRFAKALSMDFIPGLAERPTDTSTSTSTLDLPQSTTSSTLHG